MKIKILKDIPGFKAGEVVTSYQAVKNGALFMTVSQLVDEGYVQEEKENEINPSVTNTLKYKEGSNGLYFIPKREYYLTTPKFRELSYKPEGDSPWDLMHVHCIERCIGKNDFWEGLDKFGMKVVLFHPGSVINFWQLGLLTTPSGRMAGNQQEKPKDEIDIEEIRREAVVEPYYGNPRKFLMAYVVVKTVIEKLNDGWKPDWSDRTNKWSIDYNHGAKNHAAIGMPSTQQNILPVCRTAIMCTKVIDLCKPELETLFNINK